MSPPPIPILDTVAFRQKLAGLIDPMSRTPGTTEKAEIRQSAVRLLSIFARLYNVPGDRTELWQHIGKAVETSLAKVSDDDCDRFVSLCMESIQAEDSQVAACAAVLQILETFASRPPEWRHEFLSYLGTHRQAALVFARQRWEQVKSGGVEL